MWTDHRSPSFSLISALYFVKTRKFNRTKLIAILLQWKLFSDVFQQLLECLVFSEVPEPGELIQVHVAGYVFIQGSTHPLQLRLDQSPHALVGIGVCTIFGVNKVLGMIY